jgi:hypothetical protein
MIMAKTRLRLAALAGVLALAAGCDKTKMPQTYPVTGTVAFADGEPIKGGDRGGAVEFQSATDPELRISGQIKEDGTFALQTLKDKTKVEGAPEGSYTVTFLPPKREDGRLLLPQPVKLPQTFQVEAKENHFDIKIDRPADF